MAVVGGTTWMFCREELADQFDLLVVDEAGQMSLANLLVMARCAKTILLVGDQQQLAQPSQADHPGDSGLSSLEYLMQGAHVVPPDRGVFLATSWRMEPTLTAMVSELFYDGRLRAHGANQINGIQWRQPCLTAAGKVLPSQGLVFDPVAHSGCSVCSEAEIERITQIVEDLLGSRYVRAEAGGRGAAGARGARREAARRCGGRRARTAALAHLATHGKAQRNVAAATLAALAAAATVVGAEPTKPGASTRGGGGGGRGRRGECARHARGG
jgi:uncharacterized protein